MRKSKCFYGCQFLVDLFHRIKIDANIYVPIVYVYCIVSKSYVYVCILFGNWFSASQKNSLTKLQTKENTINPTTLQIEFRKKKIWKIRNNHEIHFHLSHFKTKSIEEKSSEKTTAMKFIATKYLSVYAQKMEPTRSFLHHFYAIVKFN